MQHLDINSGAAGDNLVSSNLTDTPIDAAFAGTAGGNTGTGTNVSFAIGQLVLLIQMQGTNVGKWEWNLISNYSVGSLTFAYNLDYTYSSTGNNKAQIIVVEQNSSWQVQSAKTLTVKAWTGAVGGVLVRAATGFISVPGSLVADGGDGATNGAGGSGGGFRGGTGVGGTGVRSFQGEGTVGPRAQLKTANGNGGGGGLSETTLNGITAPGAGGGNGVAAVNGYSWQNGSPGSSLGFDSNSALGGAAAGLADATEIVMGGGGGGMGNPSAGDPSQWGGGAGGGIIMLFAPRIVVTGAVSADGGDGAYFRVGTHGGGGAGGSILLEGMDVDIGTNLVHANSGSTPGGSAGGLGRIRINACTIAGSSATPSSSTQAGGFDFCSSGGSIY